MTLGEALFRPRAVALIGASGDPAKNTARPQRYLRKHGYAGRIVPINPGRKEVLGEAAYATLADAPVDVDHAFIMVEDVERALEDCGRKGVPVASIYSDGFADAGPAGVERQKKLVETARALGVRLLGPNSMQGGPGVFTGDLHFYQVEGDVRERIAQIDTSVCPLYLLTGEYDYSASPRDTQAVVERVSGAKLTIMKGLGHFPMSENPEAFLRYLRPVLQEIHGSNL